VTGSAEARTFHCPVARPRADFLCSEFEPCCTYGLGYPILPASYSQPADLVELAQTPTRLAQLAPAYQERLINWGYAICDTAIRAHVDKTIPKGTMPYPNV
jgi:hypothetical protein